MARCNPRSRTSRTAWVSLLALALAGCYDPEAGSVGGDPAGVPRPVTPDVARPGVRAGRRPGRPVPEIRSFKAQGGGVPK